MGIFETLGIQASDRLLFYGGAALVAMIAFDKLMGDEPPAQRRELSRLETGRQRKAERAQREAERADDRQDRARGKVEDRLKRLRDRSDELYDAAQEAEAKASHATRRTSAQSAATKARQKYRALDRVNRDIEDTEALLERIGNGDTRAIKRVANPADPELAKAMEISEQFHGEPNQVVELSDRERELPRYAVLLGSIPELKYVPDSSSERGGAEWVHESGDRGFGAPRSDKKPLLAVDPRTGRPLIVQGQSPMRLNSKRGLIG